MLLATVMQPGLEVADLILELGADINQADNLMGLTPLGCAAFFGEPEAVTFLLAGHGALLTALSTPRMVSLEQTGAAPTYNHAGKRIERQRTPLELAQLPALQSTVSGQT